MEPKKTKAIFTESSEINMGRAKLDPKLSSASYVEDSQLFYSTVDKLPLKDLMTLVRTVLKANGFADNFENILSCLETAQFGIYSPNGRLDAGTQVHEIRGFNHSVCFKLPQSKKIGDLLGMFYEQVSNYEVELSSLKVENRKLNRVSPAEYNPEKVNQEIEKILSENSFLEEEFNKRQNKINELQRQIIMEQSYNAHGEELPEDLRLGKVSQINISDGYIAVTTGRQNVHLEFSQVEVIPQVGDSCVVWIHENKAQNVMFMSTNLEYFNYEVATVLHRENEKIKYRDDGRNELCFTGRTPLEIENLQMLSRGDRIIIKKFKKTTVSIIGKKQKNFGNIFSKINEKRIVTDLVVKYEKAVIEANEGLSSDEEAA